ncbi:MULTISPECIES: hypothetical protein [unclassified Myxococcus]|uniref:hypothetical protein n=1 Tax=Myxococcus TaxID=32 RepID=UPI001E55C426|nr:MULTISPECIES: hypothetical protein [unclassified Myxococcus]
MRGTPVRLFTFPEGNTDESRTVVCLPGLGASGRSFAPMEPLTDALTLSTLVRAPRPLAYLLAPTVARVLGGQRLPPEGRAEIVREARHIPGARLALIRGASHLPYMIHPDAFNTLAGDFLRQHLD